jgi:sugar phosphate isomerase/epimerase
MQIQMKNSALPYSTAFSSLGCPNASWEGLCDLCRRFGIRELEIRALEGMLDLPEYLSKRFGSPAAWAAAVEAEDLHVSGLSTSLKLVGSKPDDRVAFLRFLPWADAVGGAPLRVFDGGTPEDGLSGNALQEALDTIDWWRLEKARSGWISDIIIETHDSMVRSDEVCLLQRSLALPVDILWDTHHTWKKGGEEVSATWQAIGQWVRHIHVKDSIPQPSARHPFTYVLPGEGVFPLRHTLALLMDRQFDGVVSLEWERMWLPYLGEIEEALEAMQTLYEQVHEVDQ